MAWCGAGEEVLLFIDVNKNVYTGPLAKDLRGNGLQMEEQTLCLTGKEAPNSHCTGKVAIVGMYATPGIICTNKYLSPHGTGGGSHRFQLHGFNAHKVLGTDYPKTVCPQGRALRRGVERTVRRYNKVLAKLLIRYRCVCVFWASGSRGSLVITRYQSLPLTPGKVLPICVTQ